ncbi:hypothetical protein HHI36_001748 [Cryptolaemus montrouzieri]|uniref:Uncharacterized protein n=1 Tax=Cryptolaemus montrouzieri TaxID=559131 RepID=A0ABD2P8D9_9CUCU
MSEKVMFPMDEIDAKLAAQIEKPVRRVSKPKSNVHSQGLVEINMDEIESIERNLKDGKCAGIDRLTSEILKRSLG